MLIGSANTYQGALTLNINSAGGKPIYINGTVSSSSNYTLPNGTYFVFYDGTNYYFRTDGKIQGPDGILYNKPSTGIPASDLASGVIPDISGKADKTLVSSSMPSGGFLPNVVYNLGTLSGNTTFSMAAATDNTIANIWCWTFTTPSTAPTITWPAAITGWSGSSIPTINASKNYEITVMNGLATIIES